MEPVTVQEGQEARFRVEFEANPMPVVKWMRYTFELKPNEDIMIQNDETSSTMTIKKTCVDDSGIFTCVLENPAGATKSSTNLTIMENSQQVQSSSIIEQKSATTKQVSSSSMKTVSKTSMAQSHTSSTAQSITTSKTMHVKKKDKIRIDIQFKDGSKSDLTFTHNGKALTESNQEGIEISFSNDIASLAISNADEKHSGLYECIMKTAGGEARCSIQCMVE